MKWLRVVAALCAASALPAHAQFVQVSAQYGQFTYNWGEAAPATIGFRVFNPFAQTVRFALTPALLTTGGLPASWLTSTLAPSTPIVLAPGQFFDVALGATIVPPGLPANTAAGTYRATFFVQSDNGVVTGTAIPMTIDLVVNRPVVAVLGSPSPSALTLTTTASATTPFPVTNVVPAVGTTSCGPTSIGLINTGTSRLLGGRVRVAYAGGGANWLLRYPAGVTELIVADIAPNGGASCLDLSLDGTNSAQLRAGTYTATITYSGSNALNTFTTTYTFTTSGPATSVTSPLAFAGTGALPAQDVILRNTGAGVLTGVRLGTPTYSANSGTTQWLTIVRQPPGTVTTNATGAVSANAAGLAPGTYTATVPVVSDNAANGTQALTVNLTVPTTPALVLSQSTVSWPAPSGASPLTVTITNGGTGTLGGLAITPLAFATGQPTGWVTAALAPGANGGTVTFTPQAAMGTLPPGSYSATLQVSSTATGVINSPQTVTVQLTVPTPVPVIQLASTAATFAATAGGTSPASQSIRVTNGGGGTLVPLGVGAIIFGGASGWLTAALTPDAAGGTLVLTPSVAGLAAGTYTATVPVTSGAVNVSNSPQTVSVTFTVAPAAPSIVLSQPTAIFSAITGAASVPSQTITVSNGGGGSLGALALGTTTYGTGQPTGWLVASLAPAGSGGTITLAPTVGTLPPGTYTASVPVTSTATGVTNSPQTLAVTLTVGAPPPFLAVSADRLNFVATQGGANPAPQQITVRNGNGGSAITGVGTGTIQFGTGPTGWLSPPLVTPTAEGATLTFAPATGTLPTGSYTATVPVTSAMPGVQNSPQTVTVTFNVGSVPPTIALTPASVTLTAPQGSPAVVQTVTVSNGGGAVLTAIAADAPTYTAGPGGWLTVTPVQGPNGGTLTVTATPGALAPGNYTATVAVRSGAAGVTNNGELLSVRFVVQTPLPAMALQAVPNAPFAVLLPSPGSNPPPPQATTRAIEISAPTAGPIVPVGDAIYDGPVTAWLTVSQNINAVRVGLNTANLPSRAGLYVARVRVQQQGASPQFAVAEQRIEVQVLARTQILGLLGLPVANDPFYRSLDDSGNRDGTVNLGDIVAFLRRLGVLGGGTAAALTGRAPGASDAAVLMQILRDAPPPAPADTAAGQPQESHP